MVTIILKSAIAGLALYAMLYGLMIAVGLIR